MRSFKDILKTILRYDSFIPTDISISIFNHDCDSVHTYDNCLNIPYIIYFFFVSLLSPVSEALRYYFYFHMKQNKA